ncbi:ferric reductase-like transmembrane component family protein (macronuclear) [Tetrahymena thermophila SB210]|uniref:Ferric reductase-like transmembrane component family protein n=1 Tax=Tetrahymena thermophila (strain SB210) TaxID=312017 RepID=W7XD55_TETTS|nr:ferric reductase-like transmembrane component family protein [Tetrahymena thermophila SB210]EWS74548.1 ferric reductase-like transmembrane component family protein [Tetrahymena thermophila SB210]|eukprot:XP_012652922.1 ferric reductase-like transmembrane component family protein [Tetrahymena thermophila SB210]
MRSSSNQNRQKQKMNNYLDSSDNRLKCKADNDKTALSASQSPTPSMIYQSNQSNPTKRPSNSQQIQKVEQKQPQNQQKQIQQQNQPNQKQQYQNNPSPQKRRARPEWKISCYRKIIQKWQAVMNRRIYSFSCFALQVGDVIIFSLTAAYIAFSFFEEIDTQSSGNVAQMMLTLTIIFGCRNGLLSFIFSLSLERALLWHQMFAWGTLALSINHWMHSREIMSGYLAIAPIFGLVAFSIQPIRRYLWEFFMRMHWILIIALVVGCILHGVTLGVVACGYFFLDICFRIYNVCKYREMSRYMTLERVGNNITRLSMTNEDCYFKGGQYFFIMIPHLSYFQWHPFSVFSASYEEEMVFYVKSLGNWTGDLYEIAGKPGQPTSYRAYIDGPYGSHSISIEGDKYQNFLMISGGIGVTPIISTAKELLAEIDDGRPVKNLHFIWTGRDSALVEGVFEPGDLKSLLHQDEANILQTFYHYSAEGDKRITDIEKQAQKNKQQIVELTKGRPNFDKYFDNAYKSCSKSGHSLVAVLVCGPQELIDLVEIQAMKYSTDGIRFDVHQEVFNF